MGIVTSIRSESLIHRRLILVLELWLFCAVIIIGQRLINDFVVWY